MKPKISIRKTKREILGAYEVRRRTERLSIRISVYHKRKIDAYRRRYDLSATEVVEQMVDLLPSLTSPRKRRITIKE